LNFFEEKLYILHYTWYSVLIDGTSHRTTKGQTVKNLIIKARTLNGCKCYNRGKFVGRTYPIITKTFGRCRDWAAYDVNDSLITIVATNDQAATAVFASHEAREADRRAALGSFYSF
jgi:hypothetical protein